jgi:hypothetical protein
VSVLQQTKLTSLIEVLLSTALGFVVSFCAWPVVAHLFGIEYSVASNLGITAIFTVLSIARGYVVRRFFAGGMHRIAVNAAKRVSAWL